MKLWRSTLECVELTSPRPGDPAGLRFPTEDSARAFLDRLAAADPAHLDRLRALVAERPGGDAAGMRSDAEVLDELSRRLERGVMRAEVHRSAVSAPRPPPEIETPAQERQNDGENEVEFEITDTFGDPLAGVKYTLFFPDGSRKEGTLPDNGRVKETGVPAGGYRLELKTLSNARWGANRIVVDEPIQLTASAPGFPEGTAGKLEIHDYRGLAGDTLASVDGAVSALGVLEAEWTPTRDDVKDVAGGKLVFIASIDKARATSGRAPVMFKHEFELKDDKGAPLPDTMMVARFVSGYQAEVQAQGGKAAVLGRVGDAVAWIDLPAHAGAHMKVEAEGGDARELYLPDAGAAEGEAA